jgi:hypothetical protein
VLRIFISKREEDGSWRKLRNGDLHSLYSSPNIVRAIKSRRMRWAGHVARMGGGERFNSGGTGNFSLHHRVQNGSGSHPASYPVGTTGSFPGGKATGT